MSVSLLKICDQYIERCTQILTAKDNAAARQFRVEATRQFHTLIPRWSSGLMASITHFYIDDIENIRGKLIEFRRQLEIEGDREFSAQTAALARPMAGIKRRQAADFEQTYAWIRENYAASATEKADVLAKIGELQRIAGSTDTIGEKWDQMHSFIEWIRSKNADLAAHVLPLMAEVLGR